MMTVNGSGDAAGADLRAGAIEPGGTASMSPCFQVTSVARRRPESVRAHWSTAGKHSIAVADRAHLHDLDRQASLAAPEVRDLDQRQEVAERPCPRRPAPARHQWPAIAGVGAGVCTGYQSTYLCVHGTSDALLPNRGRSAPGHRGAWRRGWPRHCWTSDGVQMTLLLIKTRPRPHVGGATVTHVQAGAAAAACPSTTQPVRHNPRRHPDRA